MRRRTNKSGGGLRNTAAAGLVPLLLLASVPGCGGWSVDPMPTWPKVQGVKLDTKTEVQLYKDKAPQGRQKIKGRFLSATDDSGILELTDRLHTDMRTHTLQKVDVRKVLTHRPILERWPGWAAMLVSSHVGALITVAGPAGGHPTGATKILATFILPVPTIRDYSSIIGRLHPTPDGGFREGDDPGLPRLRGRRRMVGATGAQQRRPD